MNIIEALTIAWHNCQESIDFKSLYGQVFLDITRFRTNRDREIIVFKTKDGLYFMGHKQDCCEDVEIKEVSGNFEDLLNTPILKAEENSNSSENEVPPYSDSYTWTFYKLATIKGYVDITWFGISNGYYSEFVDLFYISKDDFLQMTGRWWRSK